MRRGYADAAEAATEREPTEQSWLTQTADMKEGVKAYAERRLPNFKGKRSEEHTSELQSLMRISYAVLCLTKQTLVDRHATASARTTRTPPQHSKSTHKHT